jgi:hypothetical protein
MDITLYEKRKKENKKSTSKDIKADKEAGAP